MTTSTETRSKGRYGRPADFGFESESPWAANCPLHNTNAEQPTRDGARELAKNTAEFCDDCADNQDPEEETPMDNAEPDFEFPAPRHLDPEPEDLEPERGADLSTLLDGLDMEPATPVAEPVLGTFFANGSGVAHNAVAIQGLYFTSVCGKSTLMGEVADPNDPAMCTYCLTGVAAPADKVVKERKVREPRAPRAEKPVAVPEPAPEPKYVDETNALDSYVTDLLVALQDTPNLPDIQRLVEILEPAALTLKAMLPRRRVGTTTGARSGLVRQSATVQPSNELEQVKFYADAGDQRAKDILEHVAAYVPDVDCSFCLEHGRSTRHGYATAFMSVGRELRAMEHRLAESQDDAKAIHLIVEEQ